MLYSAGGRLRVLGRVEGEGRKCRRRPRRACGAGRPRIAWCDRSARRGCPALRRCCSRRQCATRLAEWSAVPPVFDGHEVADGRQWLATSRKGHSEGRGQKNLLVASHGGPPETRIHRGARGVRQEQKSTNVRCVASAERLGVFGRVALPRRSVAPLMGCRIAGLSRHRVVAVPGLHSRIAAFAGCCVTGLLRYRVAALPRCCLTGSLRYRVAELPGCHIAARAVPCGVDERGRREVVVRKRREFSRLTVGRGGGLDVSRPRLLRVVQPCTTLLGQRT